MRFNPFAVSFDSDNVAWGTLKGQVLEFGGTRGGKCRYWKLAVTVLWWKLQVLETGGIDTGGKCRYRKLQVQLTCVENAGTGKLRYSFNNEIH